MSIIHLFPTGYASTPVSLICRSSFEYKPNPGVLELAHHPSILMFHLEYTSPEPMPVSAIALSASVTLLVQCVVQWTNCCS